MHLTISRVLEVRGCTWRPNAAHDRDFLHFAAYFLNFGAYAAAGDIFDRIRMRNPSLLPP